MLNDINDKITTPNTKQHSRKIIISERTIQDGAESGCKDNKGTNKTRQRERAQDGDNKRVTH